MNAAQGPRARVVKVEAREKVKMCAAKVLNAAVGHRFKSPVWTTVSVYLVLQPTGLGILEEVVSRITGTRYLVGVAPPWTAEELARRLGVHGVVLVGWWDRCPPGYARTGKRDRYPSQCFKSLRDHPEREAMESAR